jgi:tetratricopeptide (TPR) repeat protein
MLNLVASFNVDLTTALAELRGAKLVRGVANQGGRAVEVYHDTIRDAITAAMPVDVLVGWHRRLAAALEASGAVDLEALTDHLLGAGERERASLYAARAAEQAERALAFEKSARLYGVAAENAIHPAQRAEMLKAWANALVAAGRGADAASAYERAASEAVEAEATELRALAGVQLLMSGELEQGLAMVRAPLAALGVPLDTSAQAALQSASLIWRQLRKRGFAFTERAEADVDPAALRRLDLLLGVTRGLLLHEVDRPIVLVVRLLREALEVGEPSRIVTALATFHLHVDAPFSMLENTPPAGALDVAEALARRLDRIEGRATISLTKGLMVYLNGRVEHALPELRRAEDLLRNHCRGAFYEMRICRQALAHLQLGVRREVEMPWLREWLREAENRGDKLTALRFRLYLGTALLQADDADGALAQLDDVLASAGHPAGGINQALAIFTRAQALLYKGDADGSRAMYYLIEEVLTSALGAVALWRGLALLWRARLALIARASGGGTRTMLDAAAEALEAAAIMGLPCLVHDVRLVRASLLAAQGKPQAACEPLREIVAETHDPREPPLHVAFANRALGQLQGGPQGTALVEAMDAKLRARGIVQPRRYARLFAPGIEELSRRPG